VLGLPLSDDLHALCPCNTGVRPSDPEHHDHPLTCPKHKKRAQNIRHDNLRRVLGSVATRAAGLSQQPEVHHSPDPDAPADSPMHRRAYRPDLALTGGRPGLLHIDVTVVHPAAASYVASASRHARATVHKAELQKEKDCKEWAEHVGAHFLAFGIETYGALGLQELRVVNHIARAAAALPTHPSFVGINPAARVRNELLNRISIELQRGNARVIVEALREARTCYQTKAFVKKVKKADPAAARRHSAPAAGRRMLQAALGGGSSSSAAAAAAAAVSVPAAARDDELA